MSFFRTTMNSSSTNAWADSVPWTWFICRTVSLRPCWPWTRPGAVVNRILRPKNKEHTNLRIKDQGFGRSIIGAPLHTEVYPVRDSIIATSSERDHALGAAVGG